MIPRVSVCVPAFEQPKLLARTIESVFDQEFQEFEIIVTDDSVTDEVEKVLERWRSDKRLRYFHNANRLGSPDNWTEAMHHARSDLIKILHHDDWFLDKKSLGKYVSVMHKNPILDFAFSSAYGCEEDGAVIFTHAPSANQISILRSHPWRLQFGNFVGAPSATIFRRKPGFEFDSKLRWVVDIDAYLRILGDSPNFEFISEPLVCVSSNGTHQVTRSVSADPVSRISEHLYLYSKCTPQGFLERLYGLAFIFNMLKGASISEIDGIIPERTNAKRMIEEKIVFWFLKIRALILRSAGIVKGRLAGNVLRERMARISYSQCGEDMIVDFLLMWLGVKEIVYFDIGAHHPTWLSNTYHFYRLGHRGVLVEPDNDLCTDIIKLRQCDLVLNLAIGISGDDTIPMYVMTSRSLNTLDKEQAESLVAEGREKIEAVRDVRRLGVNEVLSNYFECCPNFVSLDVEGLDFAILQAWDFIRYRPQVFCVETLTYTQNNTERKLKEIIEYMSSKGYMVYADTYLNTVFVSQEAWDNRPIYQ